MGELKDGSDPDIGAIIWVRGETFKAGNETSDLWQPQWNENQTVLAAAIHTPDRDAGLLEGAAARGWNLGIMEQSQGKGCCWLQRDGSRGYEGGDCCAKCLERKARQPWKQGSAAESCVEGGAVTIASLPTCQHWQLNNREAGLSNAWHSEVWSRTPPREPL